MTDAALPLSSWESFYVIVGSSGAALTGLQFVVIALIADSRRRASFSEVNAFGTPTVVHFCAALIVSAMLSAPWHTLSLVAILLGAIGVAGIGYLALVVRRAQRRPPGGRRTGVAVGPDIDMRRARRQYLLVVSQQRLHLYVRHFDGDAARCRGSRIAGLSGSG